MLTDTENTSLKFLLVSDANSDGPESKYRDIIFEVITSSEVYKRFDSSHEYWNRIGTKNGGLRKKLGYFEIEHIDDSCILTIACNPKQ